MEAHCERERSVSREPSSRGYYKVREIGQGSYGKAVLAHDADGKSYVMKIIEMGRMDSKQRKDTINEVKVLSVLKHPYIISYRESYIENGSSLVIIMDYAEGGDLHQRVTRTRNAGKVFPEDRIVRWVTEATLALKYLHDKHVLHRDLKSQNLFLTAQDRLRIGDFGISKVLDTGVFARTAIGTPYYLSPEICMERPYTFSSDIWALGCVLFELAALRVPFDAQSLQKLVQKITRGPAPVLPNNYTQELKQLSGDLLHRDESQRPSAAEILQRPIVQNEIRRMLREEQNKVTREDSGSLAGAPRRSSGYDGPPPQYRKTPSVASEDSGRGRSEVRHAVPPAPLKGVGASVCMDPSPARPQFIQRRPPAIEQPRDNVPMMGAGTPGRQLTPAGLRRVSH